MSQVPQKYGFYAPNRKMQTRIYKPILVTLKRDILMSLNHHNGVYSAHSFVYSGIHSGCARRFAKPVDICRNNETCSVPSEQLRRLGQEVF